VGGGGINCVFTELYFSHKKFIECGFAHLL